VTNGIDAVNLYKNNITNKTKNINNSFTANDTLGINDIENNKKKHSNPLAIVLGVVLGSGALLYALDEISSYIMGKKSDKKLGKIFSDIPKTSKDVEDMAKNGLPKVEHLIEHGLEHVKK